MSICWRRLLVTVLALVFSCGAAADRADDSARVKFRIEQRLTLLNRLKAKGEVGENNRGFAVLRSRDVDVGDVVAAENRDRRFVYAEGAKQSGKSVEDVGRFWARKFAEESAKGVWLQNADGGWYQK
ncbi:MAG: DUF1318 domain-containing protein [Opitutus sp.]